MVRPFLWMILGLSAAAHAGRPVLQLSVDPPRSVNGEVVKFKVVVKYDSTTPVRSPRMPVLTEWRVINAYDSQSIDNKIVNGQITNHSTYDYTWLLKPLRTGELTIPSMELWVGTAHYLTDPVKVRVDRLADGTMGPPPGQPSQSAPQGDDEEDPWNGAMPHAPQPQTRDFAPPAREAFFVRAEPSSTHVYQGELITLSYALYERSQSIANPEISKFPDFKGFLKEELYIAKTFGRTPTEVQGKPFYRSELIRYAVFPLKSGELRIEPLTFKADYLRNPLGDVMDQLMNGMMPGQVMGGMQPIPMSKSTQAVVINAQPLPPAPADAHFTGGVGQFQLELKAPTGELRVDQPFTVTLTIAGTGNLKVIEEPPMVLPKSIEPYQTKNNYEFSQDANGVKNGSGYKNFEYLLLPRAPGKIQLAPMNWTYFDPKKAQYVTLTTPPLEFNIGGTASTATPSGAAPTAAKVAKWSSPVEGTQDFVNVATIGRAGPVASIAVWAVEGILYALCVAVLLRRRHETEEQALYRKSPWEKTLRLIRSKPSWRMDELAILVDQWSRERLAGFINRPELHSESSRDDFMDALRSQLHTENHRHLEPLRKFWSELDILRFTGSSSGEMTDPKFLLDKAEKTLKPILNAPAGPLA